MDGELLKKLLDRPIAFHRVFVSVGGGVLPALMLSQAVYWSSRTDDPKGWFYKTQAQWEEETGMGRWEQETARKKLREMGFWYEERRGVPAKLFYRVDMDSLYRSMAAIKNDGIPHTGLRESHNQEGGIPADKSDGIPQSLNTETTTEITTETTTERGNTPPPHGNGGGGCGRGRTGLEEQRDFAPSGNCGAVVQDEGPGLQAVPGV
jgi:hypothetical protein